MLSVPIREVHELELSSICNLACVYCPHPMLQREKAHIGLDTLERALLHVEHYCREGTQGELSLTGIGEAILHPSFGEALRMCREVIGASRLLVLATNGVDLTDDIAVLLQKYGVMTFVSLHRPEVAGPAMERLRKAGVYHSANHSFVDSAINWAGQVDWAVSAQSHACTYLSVGWAVVRQNGGVDACCQDAHDLHPIGSVWDEPGSWMTHAIPLCKSCHFSVPAKLQEA